MLDISGMQMDAYSFLTVNNIELFPKINKFYIYFEIINKSIKNKHGGESSTFQVLSTFLYTYNSKCKVW